MPESGSISQQIDEQLVRLRQGDAQARAALLELAQRRLRAISATMLHRLPRVARWEQTGDVFSEAATRLHRSLEEVRPQSPQHFFRLAAVQIRRTLIDMARHYHGPQGLGANHHTVTPSQLAAAEPRDPAGQEPQSLDEWSEFHERVAALPEEPRETFDLLWYHGLNQQEAAELLGVSERTIKRRWQDARLALGRAAAAKSV